MASNLTTWAYGNLPETKMIIAASLASILVYYATTTALVWRRLRHIPGPPLASISNLWSFLAVSGGKCHVVIAKAQKKYGKIMRIGPAAVMVYDPETLRRISSARSAYGRGGWYESIRFHPEGDSVFSERSTTLHDKRKAKIVSGFAGKGSMDLEADVDSQVTALVKHFRVKILQGQGDKLDFSKSVRWFQLDLITLVGLGKAWGDLADETDHFDFLGGLDKVTPVVHSISGVPWLRKICFSELFLGLLAPKVTDTKGFGKSLGITKSIVKDRFKNQSESKEGRERGDMLGEWIKQGASPEQSELDLSIAMPAGTETSITAIRGTLLYLLTSPAAYHKLKQEIADGIKSGLISKPVTHHQTKEMPYLQAVVNEGMRMVPPVINGFAKSVPAGGDTVCGKFVPEGTEVHVNVPAMMSNTEVFGADAGVFRPERFLECDDKTRAYMLKTVDLCFGYGRWLCLGQALAKTEITKVFVELLRAFDFQITNVEQPWKRRVYSTSIIEDFHLRIWESPLD